MLVVDDQPGSVELFETLIRTFFPEYSVLSAADGIAGLAIARDARPDVILLDVRMPGPDGFEVCRRLRAETATREIPVLMVSGVMTESRHRAAGFLSGADGFLCKPFEPQEFAAQVRSLLRIRRLTGALRDRERELSDDLRRGDPRFRDLLDAVPFAVLLIQDRRIVLCNRAAPALLGVPDPAALARFAPADFVVRPERAALFARLAGAPPGPSPAPPVEVTLRRADGREFPAEEYLVEASHEGRPARQLVWIDISARRAMEAALRASEEKLLLAQKMDALGRLSGGVAHDFNNLLTSILGYAHMLQEEAGLAPGAKEDLQEIVQAAERAEHLVRHLLAFSRNQPLERVPLDLNEILLRMERLLRRTIGADIELVTDPGEDLGCLLANESQVEQVLMNLAVNARAAMASGGTLTLRTARWVSPPAPGAPPRDEILLEVSDTGCGMSPEVQARAFDPFFTTNPAGGGTGLGLSTVYSIVEQNEGRIELDSAQGAGSRFRLFFPRRDAGPAAPVAEAAPPAPRGAETILLVEDESALRRLCARYLAAQGYRVIEAADGQEGLRLFLERAGDIGLVLSDVVMPRLNGPEMVRRMRRARPELPVLFMSGFARSSKALQAGSSAEEVLVKPFTRRVLALRVRERIDAGFPARRSPEPAAPGTGPEG